MLYANCPVSRPRHFAAGPRVSPAAKSAKHADRRLMSRIPASSSLGSRSDISRVMRLSSGLAPESVPRPIAMEAAHKLTLAR